MSDNAHDPVLVRNNGKGTNQKTASSRYVIGVSAACCFLFVHHGFDPFQQTEKGLNYEMFFEMTHKAAKIAASKPNGIEGREDYFRAWRRFGFES